MTASSTSLVPSTQFSRDLLARLQVVAPPSCLDAALETGVVIIERAMRGDIVAARAAGVHFRALLNTVPTNPVVQAYCAATEALLAGTIDARSRFADVNRALAHLDAALAALTPAHDRLSHRGVPASLETRLIAASVLQSLPWPFGRSAQCEELVNHILHSSLLQATPPGFFTRVLLLAERTVGAKHEG